MGKKMVKGLVERLKNGENILCAEGYVFEFERRGYLQAGAYTPEVVLDHPELVKQLHEEFVHAGSDVVEAFTYYAYKDKMKVIGRENDTETLNQKALQIARSVADETGALMAGNICNSTTYAIGDQKKIDITREGFKECVNWAVKGNADFIIGETFNTYGEAQLALQSIKQYGNGLPAVITIAPVGPEKTLDGYTYGDACKRLQDEGAAVVGLNCSYGPDNMIDFMREVKKVCDGPLACSPVPYRTKIEEGTFFYLTDPKTGSRVFPEDLDCVGCSVTEIRMFAAACKRLGIQYAGICCGNSSRYFRALAETFHREPPAKKFSANMSNHHRISISDELKSRINLNA